MENKAAEQETLIDNEKELNNESIETKVPEDKEPVKEEKESDSLINPKEEKPKEEDPKEEKEKLIFGKYKNLEEAEKGFKELTKKLTEKNPSAPDEYEFNFTGDEDLQDLPEDIDLREDPLLQDMVDVFKDIGLTQDQANKLVKAKIQHDLSNLPDKDVELSKLGPDKNDIISRVETFVSRSFNEEEKEIALAIASTAEGVKFLDKIASIGKGSIPSSSDDASSSVLDIHELSQKINELQKSPNYTFDPELQNKVENLKDKLAIEMLKSDSKK